MERKYFQVNMEPGAYKGLKMRANQLGIPIGTLVEKLIGGLELRLRKAYKVLGIPKENKDQQTQRNGGMYRFFHLLDL